MEVKITHGAAAGGADSGAAHGSPCVVCGSTLTLLVVRAVPVTMIHCNTCGSEVPYNVTQKLNIYKARGKIAASMGNAPGERPALETTTRRSQ